MSAHEVKAGQGGGWTIEHGGGHVFLRFHRAEGAQLFEATLTPGVAVDLARALQQHARRAGRGAPGAANPGRP
jgi:hypothetical protein